MFKKSGHKTDDYYRPIIEGYQPVQKGFQPQAPMGRPAPPSGGSAVMRPPLLPIKDASGK